MKFELEKKTLSFFVGIIIIATGVTNTFQNQLISIIALFLGVYLAIKGLQ